MRIEIKFFILTLLFFTLSCSGGQEKEQEVIDFEELAGETGVEEVDSSKKDTTLVIDSTKVGQLIYKMSTAYDTMAHDEFNTIDRFGFNQYRKVKFLGKETVSYGKANELKPIADLFYYTFEDTVKTNNAFYNYLDGMATEGEGGPVKLNQDVESIKMPPLFMVVYDTVIISAAYQCEHEANDWKSFEDSIFSVFGEDYRYYIDVDCGGPLKWR